MSCFGPTGTVAQMMMLEDYYLKSRLHHHIGGESFYLKRKSFQILKPRSLIIGHTPSLPHPLTLVWA